MDRSIARDIASIAANHQAGAAEIAEQGADVFLRYAHTDKLSSVEAFRQEILTIGWALIRSQPTMAPLVNLVNSVLWEIDNLDSVHTARQRVATVTSNFKRRLHVNEAAIAESVLPLIPEGAQIVTLSRSTTVQAALRHAQHAGRRFSVLCAEARPGCEGRVMAAELSEYGIPVTLVIDTLAVALTYRSHLLMVGADHLRGTELVNKVGTYALALAAHTVDVPLYALCGSDKFLPPGYYPPPQSSWPSEQVWHDHPSLVSIQNLYFDQTPLSYIAGIVTEQGVLPTVGIEAWLASIKLHPSLH
jgi:translation initiation factor 2B subunit (eIF-2B alpha/beta/delta family)